jgi:hypothetical protein
MCCYIANGLLLNDCCAIRADAAVCSSSSLVAVTLLGTVVTPSSEQSWWCVDKERLQRCFGCGTQEKRAQKRLALLIDEA